MRILIANPGSTSYKCKLYETDGMECLFQATVQRIGYDDGIIDYSFADGETVTLNRPFKDYRSAIECTLETLQTQFEIDSIVAVGFKVVVAKDVTGCVELTEDVLNAMNEYMVMAPVHTQVYLTAINILRQLMDTTPMIGLFETAFHSEITREKYLYGIPYKYYEKYGIRKYGFHGASHKYIAYRVAEKFNNGDTNCRIISCHLGGSSSICAIKNGVSVDVSMGMSPQSGLLNAKRTGDLDPFALLYLMEKEGLTIQQTRDLLADESGLLGISELSGDFRDIQIAMADGNDKAKAAFDTFVYYAKRYVGEYLAALNSADYIVFTAGGGENNPLIRKSILQDMENLGIIIDDEKNNSNPTEGLISADNSLIKVAVIPTNEEFIVVQAVSDKLEKDNLT
jgi:acetate kinase